MFKKLLRSARTRTPPQPNPPAQATPEFFADTKHRLRDDPVVWRDLPQLTGSELAVSGPRYGAWVQTLEKTTGLPIEFILPRIEVAYRDELPDSMKAADARYEADPAAAEALLAQQWGYYFYLGGGKSTIDRFPNKLKLNRASSILRMQMINSVIEDLVGDKKSQMSVLDFACNWGGMAIDMAQRGFGDVTAFDFKADNVQRAQELNDYMGTDVNFSVQDAYNLPKDGSFRDGFDVVMNLGLLYHITDPVKLVQITYELTNHVAVFDSLCHKEPFSGFINAYINDEQIKRSGMGAQQIEMHPTYRGMVDLIRFAGFKNLVEVAPIIGPDYPNREKEHYFTGHRRTIIAFK